MPYAVLRRYVSGASDLAERRQIEEWAGASSERRAYLTTLARTWRESEQGASESELAATDAAWAALSKELDVPDKVSSRSSVPPETPAVEIDVSARQPARVYTGAFRKRRRFPFTPAAAVAAVLVLTGTYLVNERFAQGRSEDLAEMHDVTTGVGQRATLTLGDGSVIRLGVKSRLRFPRNFGEHSREFDLEGVAHFEVAPDSERPFIVRAAGSETTDLSTAFVVRAYPEDDAVQVVVTEGRVTLGVDSADAPEPTLLAEGEMGRLTRGAAVPTVYAVDPSAYTDWMNGTLTFENTPLTEVALELERWYGLEIQLGDPSLAQETFTASFTPESFSEALSTLMTVLRLRSERDGATVTLHRRGP